MSVEENGSSPDWDNVGKVNVKVRRETIDEFLTAGIQTLGSDETRTHLKDDSSGRPCMELVNELQDNIWDSIGVHKAIGRAAVEQAHQLFPDDTALLTLREDFAKASDKVFWQCLEDRRPSVLEAEKPMPRNIVLDYFLAVFAKLGTPEAKKKLLANVAETGEFPSSAVDELLSSVLETLGFEQKHGEKSLGEFMASQDSSDRVLMKFHSQCQARIDSECLSALVEFRKGGGEIGKEAKTKLLEFDAKEALNTMTPEERGELLQANAKKVDVFRKLPVEGRQRYLDKLEHEERLELVKSEILMATVMQQYAESMQARGSQADNVD